MVLLLYLIMGQSIGQYISKCSTSREKNVIDNVIENVKNKVLIDDPLKLKEDNLKLKEDNLKLQKDTLKLKEDNRKLKEDNLKLTQYTKQHDLSKTEWFATIAASSNSNTASNSTSTTYEWSHVLYILVIWTQYCNFIFFCNNKKVKKKNLGKKQCKNGSIATEFIRIKLKQYSFTSEYTIWIKEHNITSLQIMISILKTNATPCRFPVKRGSGSNTSRPKYLKISINKINIRMPDKVINAISKFLKTQHIDNCDNCDNCDNLNQIIALIYSMTPMGKRDKDLDDEKQKYEILKEKERIYYEKLSLRAYENVLRKEKQLVAKNAIKDKQKEDHYDSCNSCDSCEVFISDLA